MVSVFQICILINKSILYFRTRDMLTLNTIHNLLQVQQNNLRYY